MKESAENIVSFPEGEVLSDAEQVERARKQGLADLKKKYNQESFSLDDFGPHVSVDELKLMAHLEEQSRRDF